MNEKLTHSTRLYDFLDSTGCIAHTLTIPASTGHTSQWGKWIAPEVYKAFLQCGYAHPWLHQAETADHIHARRHVVLATGTGSGKSLAAWAPVLSDLCTYINTPSTLSTHARRPTTLYLSPTKALAADQHTSLTQLAKVVNPHIHIASCDGDTPREEREYARQHGDIILSNPDFVHYSMLRNPQRWERVWRGLSTIILDEFHNYRGMFGAHVALIIRRIMRIARSFGAQPSVVFLSATSGKPQESAQAFLGEAFGTVECVDTDSSPQGQRRIVMWRNKSIETYEKYDAMPSASAHTSLKATTSPSAPQEETIPACDSNDLDDIDEAQTYALTSVIKKNAPRRSANTEAAELTAQLVAHGARVLTFVRSRAASEQVAAIGRRYLETLKAEDTNTIQAYRGGYLPEERRALEAGLRSGDIRALSSTNALELGIDISGLDAVIVTGWPGTRASFAQQSGRSGRGGAEGLTIFIGRDNPLDQYLLDNPHDIVSSSETQVCDPSNPHILTSHICAAAAECPLTEQDCNIFSLDDTSLFEELEKQELLKRRPRGWFWNVNLGASPHSLLSLRSEDSHVTIVNAETGNVLGTVDKSRADWTVYPGAMYLHQGERFEVESLTHDVALVRPHEGIPLITFANDELNVAIENVHESIDMGFLSWNFGDVVVRSRVTGYDIRRERDGMYLGTIPLDMPAHELHTQAVWWCIDEDECKKAGVKVDELAGALHAAEHTSIAMLPLLATCDRWDIGGLSTRNHIDTGMPTVFVHDAFEGGSGCARQGFIQRDTWIRMTAERLRSCPCDDGCPRCVQSPKCGNNNSPLSKSGALSVLELLERHMQA